MRGLDPEQRRFVETRFQREDGLIVVATVAFGMGIDKPDIRWVAHADLPKSIESYYQEIGRSGRDGSPAETMTLYGPDDIRFRRQQIDEGVAPLERKQADHGRLNALLGLAEAVACRRQVLLRYFGENPQPCGNCDLCDRPAELFDATDAVRKALSAVLRTGRTVRRGPSDRHSDRHADRQGRSNGGHDQLPTFGVGRELNKAEWGAVFRQMMGRDLVRPDPERHGALRMTEAARPVLRGEVQVTLRKDAMKAVSRAIVKSQVAEEDAPLVVGAEGQAARAGRGGLGPGLCDLCRSHADRDGGKAARRPWIRWRASPGSARKSWKAMARAFLEVITRRSRRRCIRRGWRWPGDPKARSLTGWPRCNCNCSAARTAPAKPLSCTHSTLRQIAERRPRSVDELERVQGMGAQKAERFGAGVPCRPADDA